MSGIDFHGEGCHLALLRNEKSEISEIVVCGRAAEEALHCHIRNTVHIQSERSHSSANLSP